MCASSSFNEVIVQFLSPVKSIPPSLDGEGTGSSKSEQPQEQVLEMSADRTLGMTVQTATHKRSPAFLRGTLTERKISKTFGKSWRQLNQ